MQFVRNTMPQIFSIVSPLEGEKCETLFAREPTEIFLFFNFVPLIGFSAPNHTLRKSVAFTFRKVAEDGTAYC